MLKRPSIVMYTIPALFFFAIAAPPLGFIIAAPAEVPRIGFPLAWMFAPIAGFAGVIFGVLSFFYATLSKEYCVGGALCAFLGGLSGAIAINCFGYFFMKQPLYSPHSDFKSLLLCSIVGGFIAGAIFSTFRFLKPNEDA